MRSSSLLLLLTLALPACRAQPAEPAGDGSAPAAAAPDVEETADSGTAGDGSGLATTPGDSGLVPPRATSSTQLRLRAGDGSGAGISPIGVLPGRELRLQRAVPSQSQLRLRTGVQNQVQQGVPDRVRSLRPAPAASPSGSGTPPGP